MTREATIRIRVECGTASPNALERIITQGIARGIRLSDVRRTADRTMECSLKAKDLKRLRSVLKAERCRIRILKRMGFPFVVKRSLKRAALLAGAVLAVVLACTATSMVWWIRVEGDLGKESVVHEILQEEGIHPGIFKRTLDLHTLENELMRELPEASWLDVKTQGVTLVIDARKSSPPPELYARDDPGDVVALFDGMIDEIIVFEGTAVVRPGQMVKAGDILIKGEITLRDMSVKSVRAQGEVTARSWVSGVGEASPYTEIRRDTGRTQSQQAIRLWDWELMPEQPIGFEDFRLEEARFTLLDGYFLPVRVVRVKAYEQTVVQDIRTLDEMITEALRVAEENARAQLPLGAPEIDKRKEYAIIKDGMLHARVYIETLRDVGSP